MNKIKLAFYGDDFTGSTDALEFITRAGAKAILFIEPPTPEQLALYPGIDVIGVAGKTRSLSPTEMEKVLLPAFRQLKATGAKHIHYKVCSTFDSSTVVGSIGKAIDCGASIFGNKLIPVLGGTPALGRHCVFGNLFAGMGTEELKERYRLDRHPSMSNHPVTPATESDLRLMLAQQTKLPIGLINVLQLDKPVEELNDNKEPVVLIDTLYEEQLEKIGEWLEQEANKQEALFSVGSSAIEMALGKYWNRKKTLTAITEWKKPVAATPVLVISGSCSPVTAAQIELAKASSFTEVIIDVIKLCADGVVEQSLIEKINDHLRKQRSVIVHTGDVQTKNLPAKKIGTALGSIAKEAAQQSLIKRIIIAGGDTSSYAARAMEIEAVEMIAPFGNGAPLCRAISSNDAINGLEVNFKGGQVGGPGYFLQGD